MQHVDMRSSLEIYHLATSRSDTVLATDTLIEAPNWDPGGGSLLVNGGGRLHRVRLNRPPELAEVPTGFADACNNDHGFSPDGTRIALSHRLDGRSTVFTVPASGGEPSQVTASNPSYWHGWSPDGARIAYVGNRGGAFDIFTCPAEGGAEVRLTEQAGHNDGPGYSPDGRHIWFNSDRAGHAQIWRMGADGSKPRRMVESDTVDWFPHPSPDGERIAYLAYPSGTLGHPRDRDVALRIVDADGRGARTLIELSGGQGTINVPSWAPDGSAFAYVRYAPEG